MTHGHGHGHGHGRPRGDGVARRVWRSVTHTFRPHSHDTADRVDDALEGSKVGMRALWISLAVLGATAAAQAVVVVLSGSVALLSDTVHNVADALTAAPVGIAFLIGRRAATKRFTYGFGRAEDVAGVVVVLVIGATAVVAGVESLRRLADPRPMEHLLLVGVAAVVGCAGNEVAAQVRIRAGRRIGSAALVADGLHARADALTSLAVLLSVLGVAAGWDWADPVVGLAITAVIAMVTWQAGRQILARLMDAVDPAHVERAEQALGKTPGVTSIDAVRMRWVGHVLHAEIEVGVPDGLTVTQAHALAHDAERRVKAAVPRVATATVHAYPARAASGAT